MAKRRKLEAPTSAELDKIEQEFRRETPGGPGMAPIAQVASESANAMEIISPEQRKTAAELERFRSAEAKGLVAKEIPLHDIDTESLTRDRVSLDSNEFAELKASIAKNGLRLPIEVYEQSSRAGKRFGLISGYRRFLAVQELQSAAGNANATIEAFVREAVSNSQLTEAMVEENEVRSALTHYERGRISVLSVQNGSDADLEAAVNRLFSFASKAKRSKIRSFASIYEELGDVLAFPQALTERQGLKIAAALKDGKGSLIREALASIPAASETAEWQNIEALLSTFKLASKEKGGRPKKTYKYQFVTVGGALVKWADGKDGTIIEITGELDEQKTEALKNFIGERL